MNEVDPNIRNFRLDVAVTDGAQLSISGAFTADTPLADMDKAVDQLMAVADRQRAQYEKRKYQEKLAAEMKVLEQERERSVSVQAAVSRKNGDATEYDTNAVTAVTQNIQRLEVSIAAGQAAIEGLKPRLRE